MAALASNKSNAAHRGFLRDIRDHLRGRRGRGLSARSLTARVRTARLPSPTPVEYHSIILDLSSPLLLF